MLLVEKRYDGGLEGGQGLVDSGNVLSSEGSVGVGTQPLAKVGRDVVAPVHRPGGVELPGEPGVQEAGQERVPGTIVASGVRGRRWLDCQALVVAFAPRIRARPRAERPTVLLSLLSLCRNRELRKPGAAGLLSLSSLCRKR